MPYSLEYLQSQRTIRVTEHGDLKEETSNRRVYLKSEAVIEECIDGRWEVTEVYTSA